MSECSGTIIRLKDQMHPRWEQLQAKPGQVKMGQETLLDKKTVDEIVKDAEEALKAGLECVKQEGKVDTGPLLAKLTEVKDRVKGFGKKNLMANLYYTAFPKEATDFIVIDINQLINYVHNLGQAFIKLKGSHGGCGVPDDLDLHFVNEGTLAYCDGVPSRSWHSTNATLMEGGEKVEHRMGAHRNDIWVKEGTRRDSGWQIRLKYQESGDTNWQTRKENVINVLESYGFKCGDTWPDGSVDEPDEGRRRSSSLYSYCQADVKDMAKLREIAFFMGSVTDVDFLDEDCIGSCVARAAQDAREVVKEHDVLSYTQNPRRSDLMEDGGTCDNSSDRDDEELEEEEDPRENLRYGARNTVTSVRSNIAGALDGNCSLERYRELTRANSGLSDLRYYCRRLDSEYGEEPRECGEQETRALKDKLAEAAKILAARCDLGSLLPMFIAELGSTSGWYLRSQLRSFMKLCDIADDESCRQAVTQIEKQLGEGFHQTVLGMQPFDTAEGVQTNLEAAVSHLAAKDKYGGTSWGELPRMAKNEKESRVVEKFGSVHPDYGAACKKCGQRYSEHWYTTCPTATPAELVGEMKEPRKSLPAADVRAPWRSSLPQSDVWAAMPDDLGACMARKMGTGVSKWVPYYKDFEEYDKYVGATFKKSWEEVKNLWKECVEKYGVK